MLIFVSQATILPMPSFHRPAAARSNELLPMPLSPTKGPPQCFFFFRVLSVRCDAEAFEAEFQRQLWEDSRTT